MGVKRVLRELTRIGLGALVGLIAAGSALGVGELVAAFVRPEAAPVIAVGNKFILLTPESLKEFAIRHFGSNDKNVLLSGIYVAIAVLAVVLGRLAIRWLAAGLLGLLAFGAVGIWAASTANAARSTDVVPTIVGTVVSLMVLTALVRWQGTGNQWPLPASWHRNTDTAGDSASTDRTRSADTEGRWYTPPPGRRGFLAGSVGVAAAAAAAGFGGRALQHARFDATKSRAAVTLPKPASPAGPLPNGVDLHKGAAPFITSNSRFYRVDTALSVPQLTTDSWSLRIHGMVDKQMTLSFDDLLRRPLIERYITMTCVSNPVGGPYVSTAKFLGVRLADLLKEVGVHSGADQIVGTSSDGMTIGTPTAVIMDGRDAMLAVGMNDEPLPLEHGFPVRMLVPGLYGYVSATKWLVDLNATTFDDVKTYWVQRKWAAQGPIRLESRIDTPMGLAQLPKGRLVNIAGVAWHQGTGIKGVQVRINGGDWKDARLGRVPSTDTWVQWVYPWRVEGSGLATLECRAIGKDGEVQTSQHRDPFPSGASGRQSLVVRIA